MVGKGTLQQRIMRTITILVILPLAVLAAVAIIQLTPLTTSIGNQGISSIQTEGINALQNASSDAGKYVKNELNQAKTDLQRLAANELAIFNGTMNITQKRAMYLQGGSLPPAGEQLYQAKYSATIYPNFTDYGYPGSLNASMNVTIKKSAYLDYSCKGICTGNGNYFTIMQVFRDGVTRMYPYIPGARTATDDLRTTTWYLATKGQARNTLVIGPSHLTSLAPSAAIWISMPVIHWNGTFLGCIAIEYQLASLRAYLGSIKIQKTGYVALINGSKVAIAHPGIASSVPAAPLSSLELNSNEFQNISTTAVSGVSGNAVFTKNATKWHVAYTPVGIGGFYMLAFVSDDEIIASGQQLQANLGNVNLIAIIIFVVAAVAILLVVYFMVIRVSRSITQPVTDLTSSIEGMTKGDLTKEIPMDAKNRGSELGTLAKSFQNLLVTMRLGNKSYYRGDMSVAFTNYLAALELFQTTNNLRGQGMCYNNLGNIYRNWYEFDKAKENYEKAIKLGDQQADKAGLSARYNNRGLLFLSNEEWDAAKADFDYAMQIDKDLGDERGIATRTRNIGILQMLQSQWKAAQKQLDDALKIDNDLGNDGGIAEDEFQLGRLAQSTNDNETAEDHYKNALKLAESLQNAPLMKNILEQEVKLYDAMGSTALLHKAETELAKVNSLLVKKKAVVFVIDQSGSMQAEGKMTAARNGALEVFEETINMEDEVAILGFHSIVNEILPLIKKIGPTVAQIKNAFINLDNTPYQTAFYDAIAQAIDKLKGIPADEQRWIVALTDGQDNMSKNYNAKTIAKLIQSLQPPLNFILIGVGSELQLVHNEMTMIVDSTPKGKYIKIYSPKNVKKAIEDAFKMVKEIMAASEIEGFTPE